MTLPQGGAALVLVCRFEKAGSAEHGRRSTEGLSRTALKADTPVAKETFNPFEKVLLHSNNHVGAAVLLLLSWIAASDGEVEAAEMRALRAIAGHSDHEGVINTLIQIVKELDLPSMHLACDIVHKHFTGEHARLFVEMAIGVAISDGYLRPAENHVLRFLADLLGLNQETFASLFLEATGKPLPHPSDPSLAGFWAGRGRQRQGQGSSGSTDHTNSRPGHDPALVRCYAMLGLEYGASKDEVKRAYRRLARVHHPDRYESLGREAVAAATETFQRIQTSYNYLVRHA